MAESGQQVFVEGELADMAEKKIAAGYQLRYAAGQYWLLDMEQKGIPYHCPVALNGIGAEIWNRTSAGETVEQIAAALAAEYEVSIEEIRTDVEEFYRQLEIQGIITEG